MLQIIIDEGPRFNGRGPEIPGLHPGRGGVRKMATTACRWQTGTPRETTDDEPLRCLCCGEPMGRATAWPTCGACLQEGDEGEPTPSIPDDGHWPADQPTTWSAEPDEA